VKARYWVVFALVAASGATGQVMFERFWGENGWPDGFFSVAQCADNGYVAAGYTESYGAVSGDFWLVRTDSLGGFRWMSFVSGPDNQGASDVKPLWDGGFVACGNDWSGSSCDVLLVRYNAAGDTVWTRRFGSPTESDGGAAVVVSPDSCFVVANWAETPDLDLIKVDGDGDLVWGHSYEWQYLSYFASIARTTDGYILCGNALDGQGGQYAYLVRTDWDGDTVWTRAYRLAEYNSGHRACQTGQGGFIMSGSICDTLQPADASLLKVDAAGNVEWHRTFAQTYLWYNNSRTTDVLEEADGGFLLLATAGGSDTFWPLLIKVDSAGDTVWSRRVGAFDQAGLAAMARARDGGVVMAGDAELPDSAYEEAYLVKTDARGRLAVAERRAPAASASAAHRTNAFTIAAAIGGLHYTPPRPLVKPRPDAP